MAKKLSTTRKGFAIGLAVVGIAGLSLASAAQLNLTGGTLQAGTVSAACDTDNSAKVTWAPTLSGTVFTVRDVVITGIDAACSGKKLDLTVTTLTGTTIGTTPVIVPSVTVAAGVVTVSLGSTGLPATSVTNVAVVIYD